MLDEELEELVNDFARHNPLNRKNPFKREKIGGGISISFIRIEGRDEGGLKQSLRIFNDLDTDTILEVVIDGGKSSWLLKKESNEDCHSVLMCLGKGNHTWYVRKYTRSIDKPDPSVDLETASTSNQNA